MEIEEFSIKKQLSL